MKEIGCCEDQSIVNDIFGKKILFFSPAFFGYEKKITEKMCQLGAVVDMYDVRSITSSRDRALLKIYPGLFKRHSLSYYEEIIENNKSKDYDYILIVKCDMTPVEILKKLRKIFPNAKLCLYLWDSIKNIPGIRNKFQYFDSLHSFDLEDCKKYEELRFRPLFFADDFRKELSSRVYTYDVSFAGTIHSDRFRVIKQVRRIAQKQGWKCFWFMYLQSEFIYYFYKLTKREFRDTSIIDFDFEKMNSNEIASIVEQSCVVLDIQHPKQTGLTMRTIEMLGMNKKLITTNPSILEYDFYNPQNICVIDRENVELDMDFINTPYKQIDLKIYEKYSLKAWILDVLS